MQKRCKMNIIDKLKIKIFADGANFEQFKLLSNSALVEGFTTNPTLMKNQGIKDYEMFAKQILSQVQQNQSVLKYLLMKLILL